MDTEKIYRVYNRTKHDIGIRMSNGQEINIRAGSFQPLKALDIQFIDSICVGPGFFVTKQLVAVDDEGKDVPFEKVGLYEDKTIQVHHNDSEITAALQKSPRQIEAWLSNIDDPAELDSIYVVAKKMNLPAGKIKILSNKIPNKDWLSE